MSAHGIRRYNTKKVVNRGGRDTPSHDAIEVLGANVGDFLNCEKLFDTCAFEGDGVNHSGECLLDVRCATDGGAAYDEARCCGISMSNTFGVDGGFASGSVNDCYLSKETLSRRASRPRRRNRRRVTPTRRCDQLPRACSPREPDVALGPGMTALLKAVMLPATADTPFASTVPLRGWRWLRRRGKPRALKAEAPLRVRAAATAVEDLRVLKADGRLFV